MKTVVSCLFVNNWFVFVFYHNIITPLKVFYLSDWTDYKKCDLWTNNGCGLWWLTPLSIIFQLYRGGQFYWWRSTRKNNWFILSYNLVWVRTIILLCMPSVFRFCMYTRDRPINLQGGGYGFLFRSNFFFSDNTRVRIFFFCRAKREFFFQNLTLGFMTKTLNPIICLPPPKSEYLFQQHWESEYFFRKKP